MTRPIALGLSAFAALIVLLVSGVLASPELAAASVGGFMIISFAIRLRNRLPQLFLSLLGVCLVGYAFLGRGFAYMGIPPLFVGELVLGFGLLAILLTGGFLGISRSALAWLLLVFMLVGATATAPYLGSYGLTAFRDAVIWGYGLYALLVANFLLRSGWLELALAAYGRHSPRFVLWVPVAILLFYYAPQWIPQVPGQKVPLLSVKSADYATHLAGVAAFLILNIEAGIALRHSRVRALLAPTLLVAMAFTLGSRSSLVIILAVISLLALLRPYNVRLHLLTVLACLGILLASTLDLEVEIRGRQVSVESVAAMVQGILGDDDDAGMEGTKRWRLEWWDTIIDYTVFGDYFWTGKGYGINLATADGFQVGEDDSLRSPHNGHLTILARSGVPGLIMWLLLQAAFAASLLRAYSRAVRHDEHTWAKVNLWILAYWLAFMVKAAFDVFLEGPQGGIWFWSIFGLGIAALEMQRKGVSLRWEAER